MSEIIERSKLLRQNMTLENLFRLIVQDKDKVAARYLSGDEEKSVTYGVYEQRAYACAAALQSALPDAERGAFIGLQLDTCPEWFSLFWGIIAAGFNAVLVDFSLNDEMTAYILRQAGAAALITKKERAGQSVRQFTAVHLRHDGYQPRVRLQRAGGMQSGAQFAIAL